MKFSPENATSKRHEIKFVDCKGSPLQIQSIEWDEVAPDWRSPQVQQAKQMETIPFRDPDSFVAGQLNAHLCMWEKLIASFPSQHSEKVRRWLSLGVDINDFFSTFKGKFKGINYNATVPPSRVFTNHAICEKYGQEIAEHLEERLRNGSLTLWGKVNEVSPPHIVMPLVMVEGTNKLRLCHDERYLNLFMGKQPFTLENLHLIPGLLPDSAMIAKCDEKSAYDGVLLNVESRKFFGLEFGGWYMVYNTLPFGWSVSPFIYQTIGMTLTHMLRSKGITTLQYLDDRLIGPGPCTDQNGPPEEATRTAIWYTLSTLTSLGYTLALHKSVLTPVKELTFLGLTIHTDSRNFSIPQEKRDNFRTLREAILLGTQVHTLLIQKLMGKCISFSLCIPGTKLYIREMAAALSKAQKNACAVTLHASLREEIEHWRLIDNHPRWLPWKKEKHLQISLATDASNFAWGAAIGSMKMADRFHQGDNRPIHLKEADALLKTLQSVPELLTGHRVDAFVDNMAVLYAWERQKAKDLRLNRIMLQLATECTKLNCDLRLQYIPSAQNPADEPSRRTSASDSTLSQKLWENIEVQYGPHTLDLMALDSNAQKDNKGSPLPHYTPYPLPGSAGVNALAQSLSAKENYYCFPPICMTQSVIKFFQEADTRPLRLSLVVAKTDPMPSWWPLLLALSEPSLLAVKGDNDAVCMPSSAGYSPTTLAHDLYVARLHFIQK